MRTNLRTWVPGITLAVLLALTVGQALVVEPEARAADGGKLEGNWLMESTLVDCATGDPLQTWPRRPLLWWGTPPTRWNPSSGRHPPRTMMPKSLTYQTRM